jgi:hypothetical protein
VASAIAAAKAGAETTLLERTDNLLGVGRLAGILGGNGSLTAIMEARAMGGGDIYDACDSVMLHHIDCIEKFDLHHVSIFSVITIEREVKKKLGRAGVTTMLQARAKEVQMEGDRITALILDDGTKVAGDAFIDATGATGGVENCTRHGFGCAMCSLRCPTFGDRVSICAKAGVSEVSLKRDQGKSGSLSRAIMFVKESLASSVLEPLLQKGFLVLPIPSDSSQYVRIVHNGYVKISGRVSLPLDELHQEPGFENAAMADPMAAGTGNLVTLLDMAPRDDSLKVVGLSNLYAAGEKAGPKAEIACVVASGLLAGHNALRYCLGKDALTLPPSTALGHFLAFESQEMAKKDGPTRGYGFDSGPYFQKMKDDGLYTTDSKKVEERVGQAGLLNIFAQGLTS